MRRRRVDHIEDRVPHLKGGLDARRRTTKVRHLSEVLWDSLAPAES